MSTEISERSFEEAIECALLQHGPDACADDAAAVREAPPPWGEMPPGGYRKRKPEDYDRTLCLLPRDVVHFVLATQPREWQKLATLHDASDRRVFDSIVVITDRRVLDRQLQTTRSTSTPRPRLCRARRSAW